MIITILAAAPAIADVAAAPAGATVVSSGGKAAPGGMPSLSGKTAGVVVSGVPAGSNPVGTLPGQTSQNMNTNLQSGANLDKNSATSKTEGAKAELAAGKGALPNTLNVVEASAIEKSFDGELSMTKSFEPQSFAVGRIVQFGYNFFRPDAGGFSPLIDVPVGADYVIGVGDHIVLTVWGSIDGIYELEVNRSGEIILPKVGTVKIAGISYGQLQPLIKSHMSKVFKDFQLNVNIGKLHLIKVYLVGDVASPGDYNISSMSTLLNALAAAGGPTKNGSLRTIQIKRGGKLVDTVDLYDFFLKGDKSRDIRLQSGDTIFVPTIGAIVGVAGNVRRPAIYELKGEKTLGDLLTLADGINSGGYLQRIQISRVIAHEKKIVSDFNLDPTKTGQSSAELVDNLKIQDLDMVKIFPIDATLRGYVNLEGYVLRPGSYSLTPGMTIRDILQQDNILPEYNRNIGEITRLFPPDLHPEKILFNPEKALSGDQDYNLTLKEFDNVRIFSRWEMEEMPRVKINGDVQNPGEYRLYQNMTVRDLLVMAGNPKRTAYLKSAEITRINNTGTAVSSYSINIDLDQAMKGDLKNNIQLHPFDEMVVRRIPNWSEQTEKYITLKGEFVFPGVYPVYKGEKLDSIIRRAGGFTDKAFLPGAKLRREYIRETQQKRMDEVLAREELTLMRKQGELSSISASKEETEATKAALEGMLKSIAMLKTQKAEGRMVIYLPPLEKLKDSDYNFEVMGGDLLEVYTDPKVVTVFGQVYNPNSFLYYAGADVAYYLSKSGGYTRDAETADAYFIKADGSVVSKQMTSSFFGFGGFMSKELESGDTLVAPQKLERVAWMREFKDVATILGQLALAAGVLISIH